MVMVIDLKEYSIIIVQHANRFVKAVYCATDFFVAMHKTRRSLLLKTTKKRVKKEGEEP